MAESDVPCCDVAADPAIASVNLPAVRAGPRGPARRPVWSAVMVRDRAPRRGAGPGPGIRLAGPMPGRCRARTRRWAGPADVRQPPAGHWATAARPQARRRTGWRFRL